MMESMVSFRNLRRRRIGIRGLALASMVAVMQPWGCGPTHGHIETSPPLPRAIAAGSETPAERARRCRARLGADSTDRVAEACLREAMTRLGQRDARIDAATVAREAQPDLDLLWYYEALARLGPDPSGAARVLDACTARFPASPWCAAGEGLRLEAEGETASAVMYLERARATRPDDAELAALQASMLDQLERHRAASALLAHALSHDTNCLWAHIVAGRLALTEGRLADARRSAAHASTLGPDAAAPAELLGRIALASGNRDAATSAFETALAADPDFHTARQALAEQLIVAGDADAAVHHVHLLQERFPQRRSLGLLMARALLEAGEADQALAWVDRVLDSAPDNGEALTLRARVLVRSHRLEDALTLREQIYANPETSASRRLAMAHALARTDYEGHAEAEFADAIHVHPEHPSVWRAYGRWHYRNRRFARAASIFRRAVERHPRAAILYYDLADATEEMGNRTAARHLMAKASELDPTDPDYEDELARLEFLDGELELAKKRWARLIGRHPRADRAMMRLSLAYQLTDDAEDAARVLTELAAHHPDNAQVLTRLGESLARSGEVAKARPVLERALYLGGDPKKVHPLLAAVLADAGDLSSARDEFDAALNADPGNRTVRMAYARFLLSNGDPAAAADQFRRQLGRNPFDEDAALGLGMALGNDGDARQVVRKSRRHLAAADDLDLAALAARAPPPGDDSIATVLRDERYLYVDEDGIGTVRHVRSVLIHSEDAVLRHGDTSIAFHGRNRPTVVTARTLMPDGNVLEVPESRMTVLDPHDGTPLFGDARRLRIEFEGLEPGAIVDYEVIVHRPQADSLDIWWDAYILGNVDPTVRVRYSLDVAGGTVFSVDAPGLEPPQREEEGDRVRFVWERHALPGFHLGEAPDAVGDQLPAVYVSSLADWRAVDRWYHALFAPVSETTPAIAARAASLTADVDDRRGRIAAVYRFVESHVKYLGIEFGIGAYRPRPAASTLGRGRGDCKDMTALMVSLLRAVGVEAHPALVRPQEQGVFAMNHPSPGQFTHVVLYVPDDPATVAVDPLWLDATAGMATLNAVPDVLRGRPALIVDGRGGRLTTVADGDPAAHRLEERVDYDLTATGGGRIHTSTRFIGDLAGRIRQRLLPVAPDARRALLAAPGYLLGQRFTPEQIDVEGLHDPLVPLIVDTALEHRDLVDVRSDGALVLRLDPRRLASSPFDDGRSGLLTPRTYMRRVRLAPPAGYTFDWSPLHVEEDSDGVAFRVTESRTDAATELLVELTFDAAKAVSDGRATSMARASRAIAKRLSDRGLDAPLVMLPGADFDQVSFLRAIAEERPDRSQNWRILARSLLERGSTGAAIDALQRAHQLAPDDDETMTMLGAALLRANRPKEAIVVLAKLVEQGEAPPELYLALGAIHVSSDQPERAAEILTRGADTHPDNVEIAQRVVVAHMLCGNDAAALNEARRRLEGHPNDVGLLVLVGDLAAASGESDEAESAYRKALGLDPTSSHVLNNLAWMLRHTPDRRSEALDLAMRAVQIDPTSDAAWDTLAELHFFDGAPHKALEAIERALAIEPEHKEVYEAHREKYRKALP